MHTSHVSIQAMRQRNQEEDRVLNSILTWIFPLFIVCLAELNQFVHISAFLEFCLNRTSVLLFDILITTLVYVTLIMLCNRVWLAACIQGICYMTISVMELFKYSTNGNHFKLVDFSVASGAKALKNLTSFAYIKITPALVCYVLLLLLVLVVMYFQNPAFTKPWRKRVLPALSCLTVLAGIICVPGISQTVYGVFDVDTTDAENAFTTNEKFRNNSMLAFLVQTTSERLENLLHEPEDYSEESVEKALSAAPIPATSDRKPNVIVVMSESFADFRRLEDLHLETDAYDDFDEVAARSTVLETAVPTFASYTVRTEFELMFGLPVRSLQDSITPQKIISQEAPSTMVSYYKGMGYQTAYVHPFVSTFYSRDSIYSTYGFDKMLFEDTLTVPVIEYGNGYISDETVTNQLLKLVKETEKPIYIHATTMQNHQPYNWIEGKTELEVYLEGIRATGAALKRLVTELEQIDEPTMLLFLGDHFPSMRAEGNIYDKLGMYSENCSVLYEQPALIWSNFEQDLSEVPQERISVNYLTPLMLRMAGLPVDSFYATVLEQMKQYPVYTSIFLEKDKRSEVLDMLTYDRVTGENYSGTRPIAQNRKSRGNHESSNG